MTNKTWKSKQNKKKETTNKNTKRIKHTGINTNINVLTCVIVIMLF